MKARNIRHRVKRAHRREVDAARHGKGAAAQHRAEAVRGGQDRALRLGLGALGLFLLLGGILTYNSERVIHFSDIHGMPGLKTFLSS